MFSFSHLNKRFTDFNVVRDHISTNLFKLMWWSPFSKRKATIRASGTMVEDGSFKMCNVYKVRQGRYCGDERYIICNNIYWMPSGLGAYLQALEPCVKYARQTGRTLVIDWRGNPYTKANPDKNLFPLLFKEPEMSKIGVHCIADDSVNELKLPQPILGPVEPIPQPSGTVDQLPNGGMDFITLRRILNTCIDVEFPTVMPSLASTWLAIGYRPLGPLTPSSSWRRERQRLYQSLRLQPQWEAEVSTFYQDHMSSQPVVGIHVRHGNGEGRYRDHFQNREIEDFRLFMDSLTEKILRYASQRFGKNYKVFLCTDSDEVVSAMESRLESVVTRRIWRPAPGEGVDFDHAQKRPDGGIGVAVDALIDMQLLAKCDVVFATRESSFTRHIPYIMEKPDAVFLDHQKTAKI